VSIIIKILLIILITSSLSSNTLQNQFNNIDREETILLSLLYKEREIIKKRREERRILALKKARERLIIAKVDISKQKMRVFNGDKLLYEWKVSTARRGYKTPKGNYKPLYLEKMHYSRKYHNSPMPYSIFFNGGYAIHGTSAVSHLGRRASHGCVRLHTKNAKKLYSLILKYGKSNTFIEIRD
jgi:lipoprotein-anchoring transpeptidase ErfK/SrfK